jgi:hypothetical protein
VTASRVSLRRIVVLLLPPLAILTAIVYLAAPPGLAGSTLCLPFVGPRVTLDAKLAATERALAAAHEAAHAAQCRDEGAMRNYTLRLTRAGRLGAELGAYCAEGRAALQLGQRADLIVSRVLDELEEGYPWFRGTPRAAFLAGLRHECPDLVARADRSGARPIT